MILSEFKERHIIGDQQVRKFPMQVKAFIPIELNDIDCNLKIDVFTLSQKSVMKVCES